MNVNRRQFGAIVAGTVAAAAAGTSAVADDFPAGGRTLRLVIPYPPGGLTDIVSRRIAGDMGAVLKTVIIPDNRSGAGGIPAIMSLRGSPADGYTLFMGYIGSHATNVSLYKDLSYDPVKDFTPIGLTIDTPAIIAVNPGLPVKNLNELVAYARANPGKLNFASTGFSSPGHILLEMLKREAGIDIVHVPYKGTAQLLPDLLSGTIQGYFDVVPTAAANIQAGKVRALAVTAAERLPQLPDVPTARESGLDLIFSTWLALFAYGQVAPSVRDRLAVALKDVLEAAAFKKWCEDRGLRPLPGSPEDLTKFAQNETARLGAVIQSANIRAE